MMQTQRTPMEEWNNASDSDQDHDHNNDNNYDDDTYGGDDAHDGRMYQDDIETGRTGAFLPLLRSSIFPQWRWNPILNICLVPRQL